MLMSTKNCLHCRRAYTPERQDQAYCGKKCRRRAQNRRAREERQSSAAPSPGKPLPDPFERARNAVVYLTHGYKKLGEELGASEVVNKAEEAMDLFTDAFTALDECVELTSLAMPE